MLLWKDNALWKQKNENIKHKKPVKILKVISSLQDVISATTFSYFVALECEGNTWGELQSWTEAQANMYLQWTSLEKIWYQLVLLWNKKHSCCDFFCALHLFSFSLSCSACSLVEYQGFYSHKKPKSTVESYCLEG